MTNVGVDARSMTRGARALTGDGARRARVTMPMTATQPTSAVKAIAGMKIAHSSTATTRITPAISRNRPADSTTEITPQAYP